MQFKSMSWAGAAALCLLSQQAMADTVNWADWTASTPTTVTGTVIQNGSPITVTYSGAQYSFAQLNGSGTNYWTTTQPPSPYISTTVSNAPATTDIIGLSDAGTSTITFSAPVVNPILALVSWNGANVTFGGGADTQTYNAQYLSSGCGYWGCGSFANTTSDSFTGSGELHGVVELLGTYQSISFTDSYPENWHGFTVGVAAVPEPEVYAMVFAALGFSAWALRKRA